MTEHAASTALLTDHYELTMLRAALHSGVAGRRSVFEVFARHLPHGRRYGVVAGTGRLLDALAAFRFGEPELDFVSAAGLADEATLDFLRSYRFSGDIWGYAEGECYFPGSPILVVEGTFAEAVILETLVLSVLNHDCAIASAASRMVTAAGSRPLIEMGSRRTHEQAAVASARAAYLAGFATTSNLRAGQLYGIPTSGTSAHAFTLVHDGEQEAFRGAGQRAGHGHHAAGRHLRRGRRGTQGGRGGRPGPGRGPGGQRRPAGDRQPGPVAAGRARRQADQDRAHRGPGRAVDRGAGRRPGRRLRGGHLAGHRVRRAHRRAGVQAGRPGRARAARARRCSRSPSARSASRAAAAASGPPG